MKKIPLLLIIFRMILVPILIILTYFKGNSVRPLLLILMYLGLFSDVFDGIIARKYKVATEKLRRLDSQIDLFFWLSIGISAWMVSPEIFEENYILIISLFVLEGLCYAISFFRFGKETSTHAYSAKLWGLSLLFFFTSVMGLTMEVFSFI